MSRVIVSNWSGRRQSHSMPARGSERSSEPRGQRSHLLNGRVARLRDGAPDAVGKLAAHVLADLEAHALVKWYTSTCRWPLESTVSRCVPGSAWSSWALAASVQRDVRAARTHLGSLEVRAVPLGKDLRAVALLLDVLDHGLEVWRQSRHGLARLGVDRGGQGGQNGQRRGAHHGCS